ncbi:M3 family metallopeptidase [Candidatus Neomarinimicrobiota bacterium]
MFKRISIVILAGLAMSCASLPKSTTSEPSIEAIAYEQGWQAGLAEAQTQFEQLKMLEGPLTIETVLVPLNGLEFLLYKGEVMGSLNANAHPDEAMRLSGEKAEQAFSDLGTELSLSVPVYQAVQSVDLTNADDETRRYVERTLLAYKLSGVDKDDATQTKIKTLQAEILKAGQEFEGNIRDDVRSIFLDSVDELAGMPEDYIANHQPNAEGKIEINTTYPDVLPFFQYADSDTRREEIYMQYNNRGYPQNEEVLQRLIAKRHELANLLGYPTWADYITADKMIASAENADNFINKVTAAAQVPMERDLAALLKWRHRTHPDAEQINAWQGGYLSEQLRRAEYSFDSQEARKYFAYDKVRDGLLKVTGTLFGVTYKESDNPTWDPSVEAYEIYDNGELLGSFFLDSHPREGKFGHAACFQMLPGVKDMQLPQAALLCNFPGGDGTPGLMSHGQVSTFFHEFGHLLHFLVAGQHRWVNLSGFATEFDFVEAPARLLEEWIWNAEVLQTFATNEAGESIPATLVEKMNAAREFGKGIGVRGQMFYAATSLNYYNRDPEGLNTTDQQIELRKKYNPYAHVPGTHYQYSFSHLDDYSAIYYTYMWSTVIALDMFSKFEAEGMLNTDVSMAYRKAVLEPGGAKPATELVRDFLGRDYNFDAYAKWLAK